MSRTEHASVISRDAYPSLISRTSHTSGISRDTHTRTSVALSPQFFTPAKQTLGYNPDEVHLCVPSALPVNNGVDRIDSEEETAKQTQLSGPTLYRVRDSALRLRRNAIQT